MGSRELVPRRDNGRACVLGAETVVITMAPDAIKLVRLNSVVTLNGRTGTVDKIDRDAGEIRVVLDA